MCRSCRRNVSRGGGCGRYRGCSSCGHSSRWRWRCNGSRCWRSTCGRTGQHHAYEVTDVDHIAQLHIEALQHTSMAGWNFHGRFIRLNSDQRLFSGHGITHGNQQLNHSNIFEVAYVWHTQLQRRAARWR